METYVYDKAKYHYDGNFPKDLPIEQALVHTGYYLTWIINNNLYSGEFTDGIEEDIDKLIRRELTGPQLFYRIDGVLADDMLNDEGNAFSQYYFNFETGQYLKDYENLFATELPTLYHVADNWENYDKLRVVIDQKYSEWKKSKKKKWSLFDIFK